MKTIGSFLNKALGGDKVEGCELKIGPPIIRESPHKDDGSFPGEIADQERGLVVPFGENSSFAIDLSTFNSPQFLQRKGDAIGSMRPGTIVRDPWTGNEELIIGCGLLFSPRESKDRLT